MGRKKLVDQRQIEILDAFERCLLQYGLEECTLERVAQEAGKSRNIIRHYIGNRDDLIAAFVERILLRIKQVAADILENTPKQRLIPNVLNFLFEERKVDSPPDLGERMLGGMWRIREQSPLTQQALLNFYKEFEKILTEGLSHLYPNVPVKKCQEVAYSIICLAETNWVLGSVGVDISHTRMVRRSAEYLLQTLE
ncbi:MAG: TetR/AcrR family transcriptional regulator [Anaerolineales bacterium]|jgi:AcrR family transcriptional regulator|nr:TetR/AcrR family transcriptional regulator [Anaerolineales bacterium]MBK9780194.1 TetR/AcrR family transcriptional regulator [Anaerolineales bacterium]